MRQDQSGYFPLKSIKRPLLVLAFAAAVLPFCLQGCASSPENRQKEAQKDIARQWLEKAEESRGYSPQIEEREMTEIQGLAENADIEDKHEKAPAKPLPDQKVTLHLKDAPVHAVLRAMARAAGVNILVNETVKGTMSVNIENIPWNHAFEGILDSRGLVWQWQGDIIRIKSMDDIKQELEMSELLHRASNMKEEAKRAGPLASRIIKINYADAQKLSEILKKFLSRQGEDQRGDISVDSETNSLVLQASRYNLNRMQQVIRSLDKPRAQILIEANIVEATQETAKELGMRWSGRYLTSSGSLDDFGIIGEPDQPSESFIDPEQGLSLGLVGGRMAGNVLYAQLQALQEDGELNILSSPSITTMDNQTAYTEHGERIPYETTDEEGRPEVEFEDAVLRLEVVPHIIDGKHMRMQIKVKNDEVDFTQTVDGNPVIRARETETDLVVRDGETIVISGLSKQTVTGRQSGVPVLKDIPGLGWLFKGTEKGEEMEEFMIFITPTILGTKTQ
ncbi:MAG: type IV pilus secretin PilQ [Desulfobacteraceae bacterium]|nr:type IV pilus secretin PilQ [Desulfobacteraceae bacterium]